MDNGIEFKHHEKLKKALNIKTYFCQPYHSWEKRLVEQINGLIRRFLPKKTDFLNIDILKINNLRKIHLPLTPQKIIYQPCTRNIIIKLCYLI